MDKFITIAVDGTASSGKSTVMKIVSERLNFHFLDTGLMYRAYTKYCLNNKINLLESSSIESLIKSFNFSFDNENVYVNKVNYTSFLSDNDVVTNIKYVANNKIVRDYMVGFQRQLAFNKNIIMVGRDITSVVLKDATLKIYFDCSIESRAIRRFKQNENNGIKPNIYEDIYQSILKRDSNDKTRKEGPLVITDNAWVLDTSNLSIEEAVDAVINKIKKIIN
ncbi:(d)CMP kinase [Spiroplasma turonicum]|uniref:Cytidylate kinase n=1 Tax=Spiroplasma turonicum TaxID=216946 RepID=A0A0K1P884_9MOLU|nr:(d)CMP kinase [Spiroplasma turonicum]AKU80107.1 cytidylate kinase [Spiroplasma turonicum]ALX71107.1 cytidylate kinase [Spiroplasma turonicum]